MSELSELVDSGSVIVRTRCHFPTSCDDVCSGDHRFARIVREDHRVSKLYCTWFVPMDLLSNPQQGAPFALQDRLSGFGDAFAFGGSNQRIRDPNSPMLVRTHDNLEDLVGVTIDTPIWRSTPKAFEGMLPFWMLYDHLGCGHLRRQLLRCSLTTIPRDSWM